MQDCKEKGRVKYIAHKGISNGRAKLTEDQVREIRDSTLSRSELMLKFSVTRSMVGKIKQRKSWRHIA